MKTRTLKKRYAIAKRIGNRTARRLNDFTPSKRAKFSKVVTKIGCNSMYGKMAVPEVFYGGHYEIFSETDES
jgi:hypothetical protein